MDGHSSAAPRRRRRPATSCEPCRTRKLRCDKGQPCGRCTRSRGVTNCLYRLDVRTNGHQSTTYRNNATEPILVHGATGSGSSRPSPTDLSPARTEPPPQSIAQTTRQPRKSNRQPPVDLEERVERLEALLRQRVSSDEVDRVSPNTNPLPDTSGKLPLRNSSEKVRLFGNTHWMHIARLIPIAPGNFDNPEVEFALDSRDVDTTELLKMTKQLCKSRHATKSRFSTGTDLLQSDIIASLPGKTACNELIQCYMRTLQPIYRIIDTPSFLEEYDVFWSKTSLNSPRIQFLALLVVLLAIGSTFHQGTEGRKHRDRAAQWNRFAQLWLMGSSEKYTMNVEGFQVFCALLLSKQTTLHCPGPTWVSAGSLLASAMSMGLHRDPKYLPLLSPRQQETRKRLWATTMELVIQHHLDSGMPLLLSRSDYDSGPPSNCVDDRCQQGEVTILPPQNPTESSLQIALARSASLRLDIVRLLNGLNHDVKFEHVVELATKIRTEARKVQRVLSLGDDSLGIREFHHQFVGIFFHRYSMLLYQRHMIEARDNPKYHLARTTCVESALVIASYASETSSSVKSDDCGLLLQLAYVGRGSFKGPLGLHVILVLGLELFLRIEEQGDGDEGDRLDKSREESRMFIVNRLNAICAQWDKGLAFGSVSMKAYNFLIALLAQARALEERLPAKHQVCTDLLMALTKCEQYLKRHADILDDVAPTQDVNADSEGLPTEFLMDDLVNWDISQLLHLPNFE